MDRGRIVREADLVAPGSRGVVLVSGGADSAATAAGLVEALDLSREDPRVRERYGKGELPDPDKILAEVKKLG